MSYLTFIMNGHQAHFLEPMPLSDAENLSMQLLQGGADATFISEQREYDAVAADFFIMGVENGF